MPSGQQEPTTIVLAKQTSRRLRKISSDEKINRQSRRARANEGKRWPFDTCPPHISSFLSWVCTLIHGFAFSPKYLSLRFLPACLLSSISFQPHHTLSVSRSFHLHYACAFPEIILLHLDRLYIISTFVSALSFKSFHFLQTHYSSFSTFAYVFYFQILWVSSSFSD